MNERVYVTDLIGDEHLTWTSGDKVIISTPTGSGKTTFVVSKLLEYAVQQKKHIIYYCNRKVLYDQFSVRSKKDIEKFFSDHIEIRDVAAEYLHILTYQGSELVGNYPNVSITDHEKGLKITYEPEDILFYIFDEAHYFINDALINAGTNFWYDNKFAHGISVFLTATPKPLMALFAGWGSLSASLNLSLHKQYKLRDRLKERAPEVVPEVVDAFLWWCGEEISVQMPPVRELSDVTIRHFGNPLEKWFNTLEQTYQCENPIYRTYSIAPDYSYVEPVYFQDYEEIICEINEDNEDKWLIFVDDEIQGVELARKIQERHKVAVAFLSSATIRRSGAAQSAYFDIVEKKTFLEKVLIATSVLDCGIDIIDDKVKHVVITSDNETSFLQMLGRKRVRPGERVKLYIKVFDYMTIHNRYNQCTRDLRFLLRLSLKNEIDLIRPGSSTAYRDGNTYGSALSKYDLNKLIDEFISISKPALTRRVAKNIESDCNGHVKEKVIEKIMNQELHLMEYGYSETAFLNLLFRMQDYWRAMAAYREENPQFIKLCNHVYACLMRVGKMTVADGLRNTLKFDPEIINNRTWLFPVLAEPTPSVVSIDCTSHMAKFADHMDRIAGGVTEGYKKIEDGVVGGYKKIEDGVVEGFTNMVDKASGVMLNEDGSLKTGKVGEAVAGAYKKVEDAFVNTFLAKEGESVEEAKARIKKDN